jgi:hypothetical protein
VFDGISCFGEGIVIELEDKMKKILFVFGIVSCVSVFCTDVMEADIKGKADAFFADPTREAGEKLSGSLKANIGLPVVREVFERFVNVVRDTNASSRGFPVLMEVYDRFRPLIEVLYDQWPETSYSDKKYFVYANCDWYSFREKIVDSAECVFANPTYENIKAVGDFIFYLKKDATGFFLKKAHTYEEMYEGEVLGESFLHAIRIFLALFNDGICRDEVAAAINRFHKEGFTTLWIDTESYEKRDEEEIISDPSDFEKKRDKIYEKNQYLDSEYNSLILSRFNEDFSAEVAVKDPEFFPCCTDMVGRTLTLAPGQDVFISRGNIKATFGWELHFSARPSTAAKVLSIVQPILVKHGVPYKFISSIPAMRALFHRSSVQRGDFIVAYPENDDKAKAVATEVDVEFYKAKLGIRDFFDCFGCFQVGTSGGIFARWKDDFTKENTLSRIRPSFVIKMHSKPVIPRNNTVRGVMGRGMYTHPFSNIGLYYFGRPLGGNVTDVNEGRSKIDGKFLYFFDRKYTRSSFSENFTI